MKFFILFLLFNLNLFSKDELYELKLKNGTVLNIKNITEFNDRIESISDNKIKSVYKRTEIESFRQISEKEEDLRKTLILNNKTYLNGIIVFKNLKTVKIFNEGHITEIQADSIEDELKEKDFKTVQSKTKYKAVLQSLIFPGLGQYYTYNKMNMKSWFFVTSAVLSLGIAGYYYNESNIHYSRYESSDYWNRNEYNQYSQNIKNYNNILGILGALWFINAADSYFNFSLKYEGYKTYEGTDKRATVEFTVFRF